MLTIYDQWLILRLYQFGALNYKTQTIFESNKCFNKSVNKLKGMGLIRSEKENKNDNRIKTYRLTKFGFLMALSLLGKEKDTLYYLEFISNPS